MAFEDWHRKINVHAAGGEGKDIDFCCGVGHPPIDDNGQLVLIVACVALYDFHGAPGDKAGLRDGNGHAVNGGKKHRANVPNHRPDDTDSDGAGCGEIIRSGGGAQWYRSHYQK